MGRPSTKAGVILNGQDDRNGRDRREENPGRQAWLGLLDVRQGEVVGTTGIYERPNNCDVGTYDKRNERVFVYRRTG